MLQLRRRRRREALDRVRRRLADPLRPLTERDDLGRLSKQHSWKPSAPRTGTTEARSPCLAEMCIDTAPRSGVCVMLGPRVVLGRDAAFVVQDAEAVLRSGIALALKMEHVYAGVALVLMTGFPEERKSARSLRDLVDRVLAKPFTKDELLAAVAPILGRTR